MDNITVVSFFDGISTGLLALQKSGVRVKAYHAFEVDPYAIKISNKNFGMPLVRHGDVNLWRISGINFRKVDLLIAGSPCQGFSFAGKQLNFEDPRSTLFFKFSEALKYAQSVNPEVKFFMENVPMKQEYQDVISAYLGVNPILVNSSLVSGQNRKRLYWTNIVGFKEPKDRNIMLKDVVLQDAVNPTVCLHNLYGGFGEKNHRVFLDKSPTLRTAAGGGHIPSLLLSDKALEYMNREVKGGRNHWDFKHHSDIRNPKSATVVANFFKGVPYNVLKDNNCIRHFDPIEAEILQTLPVNFTEGVSKTQRFKMIGNGWTVAVIVEFFKLLKYN